MALNKLMHPRNPYKDRKPNFKELAVKYEQFRHHAIQDLKGRVHLDFKKPESLRALTWALLKEDFGLDVELPLDRLIPTVPLRLNYILWLEDLLQGSTDDVHGIDIGTGASAIYALLGAKKNKWNMLALEADSMNVQYAKRNVIQNYLTEKVKVLQVDESATLGEIMADSDKSYDFCMCNPPFFTSNLEAWGLCTSRSDDRPEPRSVSTASPTESIAPGGEVAFVKKIIEDSLILRDRVRIYTSMLGKKSSLMLLKEELRAHKIDNSGTFEFCQGRTMRWSLGWSFDNSVIFSKPPSKMIKSPKPAKPLVFVVPSKQAEPSGGEHSVNSVGQQVIQLLKDIEIQPITKATGDMTWLTIAPKVNTWSHQRRKRRQHKQTLEITSEKSPKLQTACEVAHGGESVSSTEPPGVNNGGCLTEKEIESCTKLSGESSTAGEESDVTQTMTKESDVAHTMAEGSDVMHATANEKTEKLSHDLNSESMSTKGKKATEEGEIEVTKDPLCQCDITVMWEEKNVVLKMTLQDGNKETMHQIMQFLKNKLS